MSKANDWPTEQPLGLKKMIFVVISRKGNKEITYEWFYAFTLGVMKLQWLIWHSTFTYTY